MNKILTGPKERANGLAFEGGASWCVEPKKGYKKIIDKIQGKHLKTGS